MLKPSWINEGKPPLPVERVGGRGPGREADALLPLCRGEGRAMLSEISLFRWQAGDLLVLDNVLAALGRMPFTGARRILLAMT